MAGNSFGEKIKSWREMQGNLKSQLGDVPYLKDAHDQLEQGIGAAEVLQLRLIAIRSQQADAVQQKKKLVTTNDGLHDRIGSALHFQHGPDSKALIQYGLKPRVPHRKKPKAPAETTHTQESPHPVASPAVALEAEPPAK